MRSTASPRNQAVWGDREEVAEMRSDLDGRPQSKVCTRAGRIRMVRVCEQQGVPHGLEHP